MPLQSKSIEATKKRSGPSSKKGTNDAISLLKSDHREVEALFAAFEKAKNDDEKTDLAEKICSALTIHAQVEEEIFYPVVREELEDDDLMDEALVEHDSAKQLIAEIEDGEPGQDMWEAKVKVLQEYIAHHVKEEEGEMFKKVQATDLDLEALGEEMSSRKTELVAGAAEDADSDDEEDDGEEQEDDDGDDDQEETKKED